MSTPEAPPPLPAPKPSVSATDAKAIVAAVGALGDRMETLLSPPEPVPALDAPLWVGDVWDEGEVRRWSVAAPQPHGAVLTAPAFQRFVSWTLQPNVTQQPGPAVDCYGFPVVSIVMSDPATEFLANVLCQVSNDGATWVQSAAAVSQVGATVTQGTGSMVTSTAYSVVTNGARFFRLVADTTANVNPVTVTAAAGLGGPLTPFTFQGTSLQVALTLSGSTVAIGAPGDSSSVKTSLSVASYPQLMNGGGAATDRQRNNLAVTPIASGAHTGTTVSTDQTNFNGCGVTVFFNLATLNNASSTLHIQGKDPASLTYYDILVGTTLVAAGFQVLTVHPAVTAAANVAASALLPRTWRVQVMPGAGGLADTYSVGASVTAF